MLSAAENLYVDKVIINGLTTLPSIDIIKSLNLPSRQVYDPELIPLIKSRMNDYFTQKGMYFARIEQTEIIPSGENKVNLVFNISEGQSGYLTDLRFHGNKYFTAFKLKQFLELPEISQIKMNGLPAIQNKVLSLYTTRGYLFAQVKLDSLITFDNQLEAVIAINEGPVFSAEKYKFIGNKITKSNTLLKISGLAQIRQITPDLIMQAESNLLQKPYIRECSIMPIDAKTLGIEIEETKMTKAEGVFGLGTNPANKKRTTNGYVNIQFLNLWGTDRALSLYWKKLKSDYQVLELSYHEAGLNKYPVTGDLIFQRTQQDSAWIRMKTELLIYYASVYHKMGTDLYSETLYPDTPDSINISKTQYRNVSFFWEYKKMDYVPNPSSGYTFKVKSGWLFSETSGENKTTPVNEIDAISYTPVKKRLVLAFGMHFREISDRNAEFYEQYKMGGFHSIRGYNEDEFSSWRLGWINTELRYLTSKDSRVYILLDDGFLQIGNQRVNTDLWGTGLGLSIKTKIGVMSISYALSIKGKRLSALDGGMLHLGIDSSF